MITLHRAESTVFTSLGIGVISDMVGGVVIEELNGIFELSMKYPTTGIRYKDFQLRRIIYAKPNPYSDPQPFRIYSISKPINRIVTINACHISYDLTGYPVNEFKGTSPTDTMSKLKSNAQIPHNFTFNSTVISTGEVNVDGPRSTRSVLGNNILSAYGGEYEFDNFMVYHYASRGMNRGVSVRYGKNMTDLNQEENISNVYTGVYPYWEGTDLNTNNKILFKLPERVINTPGTYSFTRILPLDLSQEFTEKPTEEKLREKANKYITDNKIGIPTVALTMTFIQLSKSTENSSFKVLDQVELGDTIRVYFEELGVDAAARCIKTTYNLCTDRYDSIDLGDAKSNLSVGISDSKKETAKAIEKQKVFFDAEVGNIKIDIAHIDEAIIDKADINWVTANYAHLVNGYIDIAQIKDASIGTAQIKDAEITVAKIQNAFVDSLVAAQGKFQSAHIGVLTSDNLSANTITADYIKSVVIQAINLNVSGKINADRINTSGLVVENIDAGKITTGTLSAARIAANTIDASKLTVGDMTNLATLYQSTNNPDVEFTITGRDNKVCPGYLPIVDVEDGSEFMFDLYCQTFDDTTAIQLNAMLFVTYTDGTTSYHSTRIATADEARTWVKKSVIVKVVFTPGKTPINYLPVLQIPESPVNYTTNNWKVKQVVVRRKNAGKLLVDGVIEAKHIHAGAITTEKIDANAITAQLITSSVIQAINLSSAKIDAKNINTTNLSVSGELIAGNITSEAIKSNVIAAINSYTGVAKIKQAQIETLQVGNANITDLNASKINAGKISAAYIDATELQVAAANITGTLTANKISGGTLDASTMTVTNLRAESITTGALTIDGDNLIHNSDFLSGNKGWTFASFSAIDSTKKYDTSNTLRVIKSGVVADNWGGAYGEFVEATAGQKFVTSVYCSTDDHTTLDSNIGLDIYAYRADGTIINNAFAFTRTKPTSNNSWIRMIASGTCPAETVKIRIYMWVQKNGRVWFARPMLQRGGIVSEWKLHVDEQISSEAITNDKIAKDAVTSGKLNIQELFVGNNAFINQLRAFEINASQITTGKITGDRIEMAGLVSFEALDTSLQPIFDVTGEKTYINGGMIAANTIKANSLDLLSGLTVTGPDNTVTFAIANDGTVTANALLQSGNFDEIKKTGYRLSPSGQAILNQALVRGRVELPNAGMTNDYDMSQLTGRNLVKGTEMKTLWNDWQSSVATQSITERGLKLVSKGSGQTAMVNYLTITPIIGEKFALTFKARGNIGTLQAFMIASSGGNQVVYSKVGSTAINTDTFSTITITFTFNNANVNPTNRLFIGGTFAAVGEWVEIEKNSVKLEYGTVSTDWAPAPEDNANPVRMWSGKSYELRDSAPFRVMQNGDVYATNAILSGILYGSVDSGFVNIEKKEFSIVDDTNTPNKVYVKMNDTQALFDLDVVIGNNSDKMIDVKRGLRSITTNSADVQFNGLLTNLSFNSSSGELGGLNLISSVSEGRHVIKHSNVDMRAGTLIFDSQGARSSESDFTFTRKNYTEDATVFVDGTFFVKNDIKSTKHNIEMRSIPNEGWGFYAG